MIERVDGRYGRASSTERLVVFCNGDRMTKAEENDLQDELEKLGMMPVGNTVWHIYDDGETMPDEIARAMADIIYEGNRVTNGITEGIS